MYVLFDVPYDLFCVCDMSGVCVLLDWVCGIECVYMCWCVFLSQVLFTCCNFVYVACSLWAHVFRNCVFSLVFCIVSALQCFLRLSMCYVCVFVLYVLFWLCVLHHIVSLRFGIFCVLGMRVCE